MRRRKPAPARSRNPGRENAAAAQSIDVEPPPRPGSVLCFELAMYLWIAVQLWDAVRTFRRGGGDISVDGAILLASLVLTWLIAWHRIGWLRGVLLSISIVCALTVTINIGTAFGGGLPVEEALPILVYFILPVVAVSFTYRRPARAWFRPSALLPSP